MSTVLTNSVPPVAELLEQIAWINRHPSLRMDGVTTRVGEGVATQSFQETFATTTSSMNWKPFIIGILPPDYPVAFTPVRRVGKEVVRASPPPSKKKSKGKGTGKGGGVTGKQGALIKRDEHRQTIYDMYTEMNNGVPPSEELLSLLMAHACIETGAPLGWRDREGNWNSKQTYVAPNNNTGGVHSGKPSKEGGTVGYDLPGTGNNVLVTVTDPTTRQTVQAEYTSKGEPVNDAAKNNFAQIHKGKLFVADQGSVLNKDLYTDLSGGQSRFIALDTNKGVPYFTGFASYPSLEDAERARMRLLLAAYPGIKNATDSRTYAQALQDGRSARGARIGYFDASIFEHYVNSLVIQKDAYDAEYGGKPLGVSTETGFDPKQHIISFGTSTQLDDPLAPVYGRNIMADEVRMGLIADELRDISFAIDQLNNLSPLIMLVNPQEFRRSHENMVDSGVKVRAGNVVHTWFEQPIKINASGVSAAQYAVSADMAGGLTNYNRIHSLSYMNLMSLFLIYKNNGMVYGQSGTWDEGVMILPGSVYIYYDDHLYIGSFDNFGITDDANKPHNLAYTFTFTVRYDINVDQGLDATLSAALQG